MTTPAGWYPDPGETGQQRYVDGIQWGPPAPPAPTAVGERRFTIHYGFVLLAVFSLLAWIFRASGVDVLGGG
jgi:hypothetical protein